MPCSGRCVQAGTKPFKTLLSIKQIQRCNAVDFDMGSQRVAYYDKDTARYQYTPGVNTVGNRGNAYRNDGVDIQKKDGRAICFNIEDGEWLQYTFNIAEEGRYKINFETAADTATGSISVFDNNRLLQDLFTGEGTKLTKGKHVFRIVFDKGGFFLHKHSIYKRGLKSVIMKSRITKWLCLSLLLAGCFHLCCCPCCSFRNSQ
jgi:endoglucanase